jgi:hypothetical protein
MVGAIGSSTRPSVDDEILPTPGLRDQIRGALGRDTWALLRNTLLFALAVVALDYLFSHLPKRLFVDLLDRAVREGYVHGLLTLFGLPSALLVTLASLAIPTLSPYANPSLLLSYRHFPLTTAERAWARVAGRGNPFRWALQVALFVAASLFALLIFGAFGITSQSSPALLAVTLAAFAEVALLLAFVYWVIRLRHPSAVIAETLELATNALAELRTTPSGAALEPVPRGQTRGPYKVRCREQERLKLITEALTQATLRALQDRQPFAAREGLEALDELYRQSRLDRPREDPWYSMAQVHDAIDPQIDWLRQLVLEGIHDVLVACAGAHYLSVGRNALRSLERIGSLLLREEDAVAFSSGELFDGIFAGYVDAFDECLQFQEHNLRRRLLTELNARVDQLRSARDAEGSAPSATRERAQGWIRLLVEKLPEQLQQLGTPAMIFDDLEALRALTDFMDKTLRALPEAGAALATAAINLGATALAVRSDRPAALLAAWAAGTFDPTGRLIAGEGETLVRLATQDRKVPDKLAGSITSFRPDFVSIEYVQIFLVLVAARGTQFARGWTPEATATIRDLVRDPSAFPGGSQRAAWICERLGIVSHFAPTEVTEWTAHVRKIWLAV